jgi:hypothetical protein
MKANHIISAEAADRFPPPSLASIKISFLLVGTDAWQSAFSAQTDPSPRIEPTPFLVNCKSSIHHLCQGANTIRLLFLYFVTVAYADGTVSLAQLTVYSVQRFCLQECIWQGRTDGGPALPQYLSCPQPYSDSCLCRTDLTVTASSFLTSCVSHYCAGNTVDISNAASLYGGYCANNLSTIAFAEPVTIESTGKYSTLVECDQECLWNGTSDGGPPLPLGIGCPNLNDYCSRDAVDISGAISAYASYYQQVAITAANAAASTSAAGSTSASPPSSPTLTTASATGAATTKLGVGGTHMAIGPNPAIDTSSSNPSTTNTEAPKSTTWSKGKIAGVAIGSAAGSALLLVIIYRIWRHFSRDRPTSHTQPVGLAPALYTLPSSQIYLNRASQPLVHIGNRAQRPPSTASFDS